MTARGVGRAAGVGEQLLQLGRFVRWAVPDHVETAVAGPQVVAGTGDGIAEALLARRQHEGHIAEQLAVDLGRKCRLGNERAPGDVAGIERRQIRQALLADGGAQAVRADQQVALSGAAVAEPRDDRAFGLREARDSAAAVIVLRRERIAHRAVDPLPGGEHLRAFIGTGERAGGIQDLAGGDRNPEIGRIDADPAQRLDQVGLRDDAGAAAGKLALHPLEDVDLPAGAAQQQPGQQAAHGAADHQGAPLACFARSRHLPPTKVAIYPPNTGGLPWP